MRSYSRKLGRKPFLESPETFGKKCFIKISGLNGALVEAHQKKKTKIEFGDPPKIRAINDLLIVKNLLTDRKKTIRALRNPWQEMFHRSARFESQNA